MKPRHILFIGCTIFVFAVGQAYINQFYGRFQYVLTLVAILLVVWALTSRMKSHQNQSSAVSKRRKWPFVFYSLLLTACLVIVNILGQKLPYRYDATKAKQHTLAEQTEKVLSEIEREIKITVFTVGYPPKYLEDRLRQYERESKGLISTEIVDPLVQIGYAAQFGSIIKSGESKAIVQSGNQRRDVDFTDSPLTEELLNNALIRVTRTARQACFLTGHGEANPYDQKDTGYSTFNQLLLANNILSRNVTPALNEAALDDCDVLIIAGPKDHLSIEEEALIEDYLVAGGDALFLIEHTLVSTPDQPLTEEQKTLNPSLNDLLNPWGLRVNDDIIVDLASHAGQDVGSPATRNYMPHKAIVTGLDYTFFVRPRSISVVPDRRPTLKLAPVILTASKEQSWAETNRLLEVKYQAGEDRPGPVPFAFVVWEPKEEGETSDTRMIVITDADFLANAYINSYSNAELGLNVVNWLTESDYQVLMKDEEAEVPRLDLTSRQKRRILVLIMFLPLLIGFYGMMRLLGWKD